MIKLGDYCEDDAREITDYLRDAGIKYDTRKVSCISAIEVDFLDGRQSELREIVKDFDRYDRCIQVLKSVLAKKPTPEDFKELFLSEYDPSWEDDKKQFYEVMRKSSENSQVPEEEDKDKVNELFLRAAEDEYFYHTAAIVLKRNRIEIGEDVGDRLDDPILRIPMDKRKSSEDLSRDSPLRKKTTFFNLIKNVEIFVDEITAANKPDIDEDFFERYPVECGKTVVLGLIVSDMMERPASGKMDRNEFIERSVKELEEEGNFMIIDFEEGAEDLIKILEKKEIIKTKGNFLKWKH